MLIISIPKSGSTSLMKTLGLCHQVSFEQKTYRPVLPSAGFQTIGKYHWDLINVREEEFDSLIRAAQVYKQHFPPTKENLEKMEGKKIVVLLRKPEDIVRSYWRSDQKKMHPPKPEFMGCVTEPEWLLRAEEIGLIHELRAFADGYLKASGDKCIVWFDDMIAAPQVTLNKIEEYLGLPLSRGVHLEQERYTRSLHVQRNYYKPPSLKLRILNLLRRIKNKL